MTTPPTVVDVATSLSRPSCSSAAPMKHSLEWHVKSFRVRPRRTRRSSSGSSSDKATAAPTIKTILQDVAGRTVSGELTAILGPSGAGKTTLLECISLRNRNFDGCVQYDRQAPQGRFFTLSAFVHQEEMLYGFLTPREHLTFHAVARMSGGVGGWCDGDSNRDGKEGGDGSHPRQTSRIMMIQRVEEVIKEVKLEKCAETLIGGSDPVFAAKGISGGERKRLTIATELLLTPEAIFLDEPNTGLDSVMSESVSIYKREVWVGRTEEGKGKGILDGKGLEGREDKVMRMRNLGCLMSKLIHK